MTKIRDIFDTYSYKDMLFARIKLNSGAKVVKDNGTLITLEWEE